MPSLWVGNNSNSLLENVVEMMQRVLFLCTGNYFRSRFSEEWFNYCVSSRNLQDRLEAKSAGLAVKPGNGNVGPMAIEAIAALTSRGVVLDRTRLQMPHQLSESELMDADCVVAVDAETHRPMVQAQFPAWESRILFWDVKDLGEGDVGVDPITQLQHRVEELVDRLGTKNGC
jgi:protein-tyrosine phosphatase